MADKATIEGELCVKEILKARGIKMKDLAEQIDIAPETLFENGTICNQNGKAR